MLDKRVAAIIRVDHAGEYGAKRIYEGQLDFIRDPEAKEKIRIMREQELEHLQYFTDKLEERGERPTLLQPLWHVAGYALGAVSALLGEKTAMATTIAVESVIVEHYQKQLDMLGDEELELKTKIKKFQDDEGEHLEIGMENHGMEALLYKPGEKLIKLGSRAAIWLSERF
jgi:3-demethoxyubiquinol 3-hydroxylase